MRYRYRAYRGDKLIKGYIEASSLNEARDKLGDLVIVDIGEVSKFEFSFLRRATKKELSKVLNVLGLYLKANIPIVKAINLTKTQSENRRVERFLDKLQNDIKEGKSFYTSLSSQKTLKIPTYIINAIKVGEESGKLSIVLIEMSRFLKDEDRINSKTLQSLIYPSFIVVVAIFMVSFMLTVVVPKIVKIFANLNQKLPKITLIVIESGNFLKNNYGLILTILLFSVFLLYFSYKKFQRFRLFADTLFLKIPVIGTIIVSKELGRFSYLTYILVSSGVNYINAINLSANTIDNEKIREVFKEALEEVKLGKNLSITLQKAGFDFDRSFLSSLALAEETGEIANILQNVSEIYFEENESKINTLLSIIEPTLIVFIGTAIGFIVTALLLPMFSMNLVK